MTLSNGSLLRGSAFRLEAALLLYAPSRVGLVSISLWHSARVAERSRGHPQRHLSTGPVMA